jgi:hypothetical protein
MTRTAEGTYQTTLGFNQNSYTNIWRIFSIIAESSAARYQGIGSRELKERNLPTDFAVFGVASPLPPKMFGKRLRISQ